MKKKLLLLVCLFALFLIGCNKAKDPNPVDATQKQTTNETTESETVSDVQEPSSEPEKTSEPATQETTTAKEKLDIYLKDVFAEHGMKVGTCLSPAMINGKKVSKLITEQFNTITLENAMKPDYIFNKSASIEEGNIVVEFNQDMIKMLDWAKENGMAVRGHTLIWYSQTPSWIFHEDFDTQKPLVSREIMLDRMDTYIKQVFEKLSEAGYSDMIYAYDVVNEAWMEDGSMRESDWTKTIGEDYLWYAFMYANRYAPENIDLYYNDYNEQYKADTFLDFVETLKDDEGNYLIDGIGLQAHLYTQDDMDEYFEAVDKLCTTGLKIEMTELDVSLGKWQGTLKATDENLKVQGQYYYNLINGLFARKDAGTLNMDSLTFWGVSDTMSWRKDASPLLFDGKYNPKYAFYGAMQLKDLAGFDN